MQMDLLSLVLNSILICTLYDTYIIEKMIICGLDHPFFVLSAKKHAAALSSRTIIFSLAILLINLKALSSH